MQGRGERWVTVYCMAADNFLEGLVVDSYLDASRILVPVRVVESFVDVVGFGVD